MMKAGRERPQLKRVSLDTRFRGVLASLNSRKFSLSLPRRSSTRTQRWRVHETFLFQAQEDRT